MNIHDKAEAVRLQALRNSGLLDSAPDPRFDNVTALARDIFKTSIALISLVDEHRQWFKSNQGLEGVTETARDLAFCDHAIRTPGVMVVENALEDERFKDNPLVTGEPNIRFYAGAPIISADGYAFGTLCLIDQEPRTFTSNDRQRLASLANIVTGLVENHQIALDSQQLSKQISKAAELNQVLLDSSDAGILHLEAIRDASGKVQDFLILAANRANENFNGSKPEDLVGRRMLERFPALADRAHFQDYLRVLEDQITIRREVFYNTDGVRPHWFDTSMSSASPDTVTVTFFPVTGKRIFQSALEKILSAVPHAALNPQRFKRDILEIGATALGMGSATASQISDHIYTVRETWGDQPSPAEGEQLPLERTLCSFIEKNRKLIHFQDTEVVEGDYLCARGLTPYRSYIGAPIHLHGEFYGAISFKDVTPREGPFEDWEINLVQLIAGYVGQALEFNQAFQQRRNLARELRTVLDNVPAQIWMKDDNNFVIRANKAAADAVNIESAEALEGMDTRLLYPEMAEKYLEDDLNVINSGKVRRGIIETNAPVNGVHRWMSTDKIPMKGPNGERRILVVANDITALKEHEEQLARLNDSLSDFAFVAAHDLQAPLRQTALFGELLKSELEAMDIELSEDALDYMQEMDSGIRRMRSMVGNLYDLFRLDSEKIEMTDCDLNEIVANTKTQVTHLLTECGCSIEVDDLPHIQGSESLLTQLFQNLIANACKYADVDNLKIRVWSESDVTQRALKIYVEDNGTGIPAHAQKTIFEPFKRLHHADSIPGAGIGLSLCKKICALHKADINVDPNYKDGARFVITLGSQRT